MCEAAGMCMGVGEHMGHVGVDHAGTDAWGRPQVASGRPSECRAHVEGVICRKTCRGGHGTGLPRGAGHLDGWEVHLGGWEVHLGGWEVHLGGWEVHLGGWEAHVGSTVHWHARVGRCNWWACGCIVWYTLVA